MTISEIAALVQTAHHRIKDDVLKTPLVRSQKLSDLIQGEVFLKLESKQHTGSFKARGALHKVKASLPTELLFVTASTGNHGAGFGRAIELTGQKGLVCLPKNTAANKLKKIKQYDIDIKEVGDSPLEAELFAKAHAREIGAIYVSPYNDYDVLAGQGTIGLELAEQAPGLDDVLITIGGGGLIAGIGAYLKEHITSVNVLGCEPRNSMEMTLSLQAGQIVDQEDAADTLSDGSAGGIEPGAVTFSICQSVINDTIIVDESTIQEAIRLVHQELGLIIEGAAGVAIAALLQDPKRFAHRKVAIVICGGNIDGDVHASILDNTYPSS